MGEGKESEKNLLKMFFYDFLTEGQNQSIKTTVKRQCNVLQEFYSAKQRNLFSTYMHRTDDRYHDRINVNTESYPIFLPLLKILEKATNRQT